MKERPQKYHHLRVNRPYTGCLCKIVPVKYGDKLYWPFADNDEGPVLVIKTRKKYYSRDMCTVLHPTRGQINISIDYLEVIQLPEVKENNSCNKNKQDIQ